MEGHRHDHGHDDHHGHDHGHGHEHDEEVPDVSEWVASAQKLTCPACGAGGALTLGGGIFCPTCGEITTSAGFQARPPAPGPEQSQD